MKDHLVYLINHRFAHYVDTTIHQCKVTQRETLEAQRTPPKLEDFTDDEIYELWDYWTTSFVPPKLRMLVDNGTKGMEEILDSAVGSPR